MVTIIDYKQATNSEGENFFMLVVQGGVESVKSKETGRFYLTARKATVTSTFDERTCKELIGQKLSGGIEKVETKPYSFIIEETGEEITLQHRNVYNPDISTLEETVFGEHSTKELVAS